MGSFFRCLTIIPASRLSIDGVSIGLTEVARPGTRIVNRYEFKGIHIANHIAVVFRFLQGDKIHTGGIQNAGAFYQVVASD